MNLVEQLLKIDRNEIKVPTCTKKMHLKKLNQAFEFECKAIDAEKVAEIQKKSMQMNNFELEEMDLFEMKMQTVLNGCKDLKNKELMEHFKMPTPYELIKFLMTSGEIDELNNTINGLSAYREVDAEEIKN